MLAQPVPSPVLAQLQTGLLSGILFDDLQHPEAQSSSQEFNVSSVIADATRQEIIVIDMVLVCNQSWGRASQKVNVV